jgi:hypothetical protein
VKIDSHFLALIERASKTLEASAEAGATEGLLEEGEAHEIRDLAQELRDHATAASFDFVAHLHRQRVFSERTFGPGERTQGVIDHIRKELCEIEQSPDDIEEWIDVVILALDGAWRAGYTPTQIVNALVQKQEKNEGRKWPDWRTAEFGKAIEHVRGEPHDDPLGAAGADEKGV